MASAIESLQAALRFRQAGQFAEAEQVDRRILVIHQNGQDIRATKTK